MGNLNKTSKLYFIIGSSGIGKSTIVPLLKSGLSNDFDIHDFDEKLTAEVAMDGSLLNSWRKETTAFWIQRAGDNAKNKRSTVIIGLAYPKEIVELKSEVPISFCFLDASDEKIRERLMGKRFSTPERIAGLKQATGQTPKDFIKENKILVEKLRQEVKSLDGVIIDTTDDTPKQTTAKIINWISPLKTA